MLNSPAIAGCLLVFVRCRSAAARPLQFLIFGPTTPKELPAAGKAKENG
ncbi:MAG: hypothetical protein P4L55_22075 [Syntrophobacteraceae bacterium]|nr:hypothetical protein [Syntrophobacteraceae bacterium]